MPCQDKSAYMHPVSCIILWSGGSRVERYSETIKIDKISSIVWKNSCPWLKRPVTHGCSCRTMLIFYFELGCPLIHTHDKATYRLYWQF